MKYLVSNTTYLQNFDGFIQTIWTPYAHQLREERDYMEMKLELILLLSADKAFQKSNYLPPQK